MPAPARARRRPSPAARRPASSHAAANGHQRANGKHGHRSIEQVESEREDGKACSGRTTPKRRERKNITHGIAHIKSSFNNTIITISDQQGNTLAWASAGNVGFKGSRKSTPFAAQLAAETAARRAMEHGVRRVDVRGEGPGLRS